VKLLPKNSVCFSFDNLFYLVSDTVRCSGGKSIDDFLSYTPTTDVLDDLEEDQVNS